jgi:hypothetical protein
MVQRFCLVSSVMFIVAVPFGVCFGQAAYQVKTSHPRLFIEDVRELARRCDPAFPGIDGLADDYEVVKQRADSAVQRGGIRSITNQWAIPEDLIDRKSVV